MYVFRTHSRLLPDECIAYLVDEVKKKQLPGVQNEGLAKLKAFFPRTNEGVSVETVLHNLNILVRIHDFKTNKAQVFLPTLVWFEAAGFTDGNLKEMLDANNQALLGEVPKTLFTGNVSGAKHSRVSYRAFENPARVSYHVELLDCNRLLFGSKIETSGKVNLPEKQIDFSPKEADLGREW